MKLQRRGSVKKPIMILLFLPFIFLLISCGDSISPSEVSEEPTQTINALTDSIPPATAENDTEKNEEQPIMSFSDFLIADEDSPVTAEGYIQAKDAWHEGFCSVYVQNEEGAYYLERLHCSQDEYQSLHVGRKIRISGYKSHWNDSLEISDATFQVLDGEWFAKAIDATEMIGTDELILHQNEKAFFRNMTIEAMPDGYSVFYYGWDNTKQNVEDAEIFFRASSDDMICDFTIKPSFCQKEQEILQILKSLHVGDTVDLTGYLRFYNGALPRIVEIVPKNENSKVEA